MFKSVQSLWGLIFNNPPALKNRGVIWGRPVNGFAMIVEAPGATPEQLAQVNARVDVVGMFRLHYARITDQNLFFRLCAARGMHPDDVGPAPVGMSLDFRDYPVDEPALA